MWYRGGKGARDCWIHDQAKDRGINCTKCSTQVVANFTKPPRVEFIASILKSTVDHVIPIRLFVGRLCLRRGTMAVHVWVECGRPFLHSYESRCSSFEVDVRPVLFRVACRIYGIWHLPVSIQRMACYTRSGPTSSKQWWSILRVFSAPIFGCNFGSNCA